MATTYYVDGAAGSDANAGTSPGAGNAWATIGHAMSTMAGGDTVWVKASATYAVTATLTPPSGTNDHPTQVLGYASTTGDGGQPTVQISSGSFYVFTVNNVVVWLKNFVIDCNSAASSRGVSGSCTQCLIDNVTVKNFTDFGVVTTGGPATVSRCLAVSNAAGATAGLYGADPGTEFIDCAAVGLTCKGFRLDEGCGLTRCVAANNSGGTSDGLYLNGGKAPRLTDCVFYNNGRAGVRFDSAGSSNALLLRNSVLAKNAGYGVDNNTGTATLSSEILADYNFFWSNTSGPRNNFPTGAHDAAGSGDPFASPAGSVTTLADVWTNFAPNNTAGAGAALRAAGYPASLDVGAVQHADPAAAAAVLSLVLPPTTTY